MHKLSTVHVRIDHDDVLPSYNPPPKSSSSFSTLATPSSCSSLAKGKAQMTIENYQNEKDNDLKTGFITIALHESTSHSSSSSKENITSVEPSFPQFPSSYQSRFLEGPMPSPLIDHSHSSHHHPRALSTSGSYDHEQVEERDEEGSVRISISDAYPASCPPTPPLYQMGLASSPRSTISGAGTFGRRESRVVRHDSV